METVHIASCFTDSPGGRARSDGPFSGEEFREVHLVPRIKIGKPFIVDMDGTFGFATSFIEEAFGGLSRQYGSELVLKLITFKSDEDLSLIATIREYIKRSMKN